MASDVRETIGGTRGLAAPAKKNGLDTLTNTNSPSPSLAASTLLHRLELGMAHVSPLLAFPSLIVGS